MHADSYPAADGRPDRGKKRPAAGVPPLSKNRQGEGVPESDDDDDAWFVQVESESEGEGEEAEGEETDEFASSRPAIAKDVTGGVRLLPYVPPPSIDATLQAFYDDAQRSGYRPHGRPDYEKLRQQLLLNSKCAQARKPQPPDLAAVEMGLEGARHLVVRLRVEKSPCSTAGLGDANPVNHRTSWVLGANPDTTRDATKIGTSAFNAQDAPYVKAADGSVVGTLDTVKLQHAMLALDPSKPDHTSVRTCDLLFATPFDSNERMSEKNRTYKDPSKDTALVAACAPFSMMPGLRSQTSWATVSDGGAQLGALEQQVNAGAIECIWHAGPSVLRLFGKTPGEVELTPGSRGKQRFGLFFVVLPDPPRASTAPPDPSPVPDPPHASTAPPEPSHTWPTPLEPPLGGKWEAIVPSHPKLKGPNATPTTAVQVITGNLNVLRRWSGLAQIDPNTSPMWLRTSKVRACVGWRGAGLVGGGNGQRQGR